MTSTWVLIILFVHAEGVHSIAVPFSNGTACEQAAASWRAKEQFKRIREVVASCHRR